MDFQGYVFITGRLSDMYISGGSNIYPLEIEEKMLQHPSVSEVAVVGIPDKTWGEVGVAVCVWREKDKIPELEMKTWLKDKIANYKVPKRIFFWDALPKSSYGKIAKRVIREKLYEGDYLTEKKESLIL